MTTQRNSYSRQFKIDAVKLVTDHGYKISEAARNLEINPNLLGKWKNQLAVENDQAFPGKGYMTPEKEELHRLRKENQRLRMEHEILKKPRPSLRKSRCKYDFIRQQHKAYLITVRIAAANTPVVITRNFWRPTA